MLEYYKYDLYGKPTYWNASSPSSQLQASNYSVRDLHSGARWIPEIGLYDDRNRFMSPDLGRFLQPDPIGFKGDASNLYRYCGNDWANRTDPMGLGERESNPILQEQIRYSQQLQQQQKLQGILNDKLALGYGATQLAGLYHSINKLEQNQASFTMAQQSPSQGAASNRPGPSGYAPGQPYRAERTPTTYPTFEKNGKLVALTDWRIQIFDKNGPFAGVNVSEPKNGIEHLAQKDVGTSRAIVGFTQKTNKAGFLPNPDHWQQSFTSSKGFDTIRQTLVSGGNTLQWVATQSPAGVDVYTHQTGYFMQPGN